MDSVDEYQIDSEDDQVVINKPIESFQVTVTLPKCYHKELTRFQRMMASQIADLKRNISAFTMNEFAEIESLDQCNIILFGPTGSGKSSLIKYPFLLTLKSTLFMALHGTMDPAQADLLQVKKLNENEGTKHFSKFMLRQRSRVQVQGKRSILCSKAEINLLDTRGQILLNPQERKQIELLIEGKVKHMSAVKQRTYRYSYLLWEFWKQDHELFPQDILQEHSQNRPNCVVLVFDGSLDQVPNGSEETQFYRSIIAEIARRGYGYPQIVLTHLDKAELSSQEEYQRQELIDSKIHSIVTRLSIPRKNIHFIENYHSKVKDELSVRFYALKLLSECLASCQFHSVDQSQQYYCQFI